jgi:hypothetical protein
VLGARARAARRRRRAYALPESARLKARAAALGFASSARQPLSIASVRGWSKRCVGAYFGTTFLCGGEKEGGGEASEPG